MSLSPERRLALQKRRAWTLAEARQWDEALEAITEALEIAPDDLSTRVDQVTILGRAGRLKEALAVAESACRDLPDAAGAQVVRGDVLRKLARPADAIEAYRRALEIDEGSAEALAQLGNAAAEAGRFEEALEVFDRVVTLRPRDAEAVLCRGLLLARLERYADGLAEVDRALEMDGRLLEGYVQRARILRRAERLDLAQEAAALAVQKTPRHVEGHILAADIALDRGDLDLAREMSDKAQKLDEADPEVWRVKSILHARAGRAAPAAVCRGLSLLCRGQAAEALQEMEAAIDLDPALFHGWHNKGTALEALGRLEEAEAAYRKAIALEESAAKVHLALGLLLYERLDRPDEALPVLQRAVAIDKAVWSALPPSLQKRVNKPAFW